MKNILLVTCLFLYSLPFIAQERWSAEVRPGLSFPTEKLGDNDLKVGYGLEAKVAYKVMPHLKAFAGWAWNEFGSGSTVEPPNITLNETGYTFGFELTLPISQPPLTYYVFAGGIYNHIELENITTGMTTDSDHALGWQLGGGLEYDIAPHWSLRPEFRYHALKNDIELSEMSNSVRLNYFAFSIGLMREF